MRKFIHILFWTVILIYTFLTILSENESFFFAAKLTIELVAFMLIITYIHFNVFTKYFWKKKYFNYSVNLALLILVAAGLFQYYFTAYYDYSNSIMQTGVSIVFVLFLTTSLKVFRRTYYQKIKLQKIQNQQLKMENEFLKRQINPHFLFNSLNTIYSMSLEKSDLLPDTIIKLSVLMRYLLESSGKDKVDLKSEIEFIENYVALEQSRLSEDYSIQFTCHGEFENQEIAPMLLVAIVENCFKHGLDKINTKGKVVITISVSENYFELLTENRIYIKSEDSRQGVGLVNLRKRLELIYPDRHSLRIMEKDSIFRTELRIFI